MTRLKTLILAATAIPLAVTSSCAQTQGDTRPWTEIVATDGLAAANTALAAREQTAETAFTLGAIRFMQAFEAQLQVRYANNSGPLELIPGMRTTLPGSPDGEFDPAFLENALKASLVHLAAAETALQPAVDGEFAVEVPLDVIWLDVNADGERQDWESLQSLLAATGMQADWEEFGGVIRFDTADAEWLLAYVHLLSGINETILSLDPTPAIAEVWEGRQLMEAAAGVNPDPIFGSDDELDTIASALLMLDGVPDKTRTRAALAHFKAMIAHNRVFWTEVAEETDNDREWLPNPNQQSVFGVEVTEELSESWQDVLAEFEAVLNGDLLLPHWRLANEYGATEGVGINFEKFMTDPGNTDVVLMIQGAAFAPYLEEGELSSLDSFDAFSRLTRGNNLLFAAWFN